MLLKPLMHLSCSAMTALGAGDTPSYASLTTAVGEEGSFETFACKLHL